MGKVDTVTKAYMRKNNIFADAFNYRKRLIFRYDRKIPDYFSVVGAP